ncbi:MAG: DUF3810 domain-containing protein [Lachnospiraceae bacterium]|nr:DUF3810 domain-containing protein [Lachnospiraceae bacterium]
MKKILKSKRLWCMLSAPFSLILLIIADNNSTFVDVYRDYLIIPQIARIYSLITGIFPFSVAEILIWFVGAGSIVIIIYFIISIIKKKEKKKFLFNTLFNILTVGAVLFSIFILFCGIYYNRRGISEYIGYEEVEEISAEELYEVCVELANQVNELSYANEDMDFSKIAEETRRAYDNLGKKYSVFSDVYGKPKGVIFSEVMSYTGIAGVFSPFTMEANVNTAQTSYNIPFDACHEMAHMYGFMREDEANFIAYLACMESDNDYFKYSGAMLAFILCHNELFEVDLDLWEKADELISYSVNEDLIENSEYWDSLEETEFGETISDISENINDTYLKANGQEEGVVSYTRMVKLMVAKYRYEKNQKSALQ